MSDAGWVLAYGSLVDPADPLVRRLAAVGRAVPVLVPGLRRTWAAGMENRAPENDDKHYVDPAGTRPDVCVATLSADEVDEVGPPLNALALPVDADGLARTDRRERRYVRVDVADRCTPALGGAAWIYTATPRAREAAAAAAARGRAVVRRGYAARVEAAFRARGEAAWAAYVASTDPPPHPLADLALRYAGVAPGE
ncbi:hypothetical protein [Patulibacter sp. SYSU D01012]|uniref:hypothetical protein n=1 Tax=Patulibacter sp. SYSU D01012 TaxID=2817381 RepID=UPI001B3095D1|nr:hypothetical protein [Patulibacter sp. SYSU D01012]